ncbi:phospholipid phosphatase 1 [Aethina tumida]|uniref:phospholipid phosphatase 1 n=1 Tax=Aethina tumida TaxID=116153 RepID=UPI0021478490|nr:phospholipid phosphatase 1 [Aethina tumida]
MIHRYFIYLLLLLLLQTEYSPFHKQGFFCQDQKLSRTFTKDTVHPKVLIWGTVVGSVVLATFIEYLHNKAKLNFSSVWSRVTDFNTGAVFVLVMTEILKITVGEPRPHFLTDCRPFENQNCTPGAYVNSFVCSNNEWSQRSLRDLSKSFPSGHSSLSVFTAIYFIHYIRQVMSSKHTVIKFSLITFLICWHLTCALSRIYDNKHHWWDVLAGIGLGTALGFYKVTSDNRIM